MTLRRAPWVTGPLALYGLMAWLVTYHWQLFIGDDLARIANASYVLFSRNPHLAAIGFVWTPLPSALELPLVAVLRPLNQLVLAGALLTVVFSAINVVLLRRILLRTGLRGPAVWVLVAVYAVNPFVLFYAANGMSEAPFMATILLLTERMMAWRDTGSPGALLAAGLVCAAAFGMRFEGFTLAGAGVAAIALLRWYDPRTHVARWSWERFEGESIAFLVPFAYITGLWLLVSWILVGSPLYFINGSDNSAMQSLQALQVSGSPVAAAIHHPVATVGFVALRASWFMPVLLPALLGAGVLAFRGRRPLDLLPLLFPAAVLAFHTYWVYAGKSYGEFRYFCYSLPLGIVATAIVLTNMPEQWMGRVWRVPGTQVAVLALAALSLPATFYAMTRYDVGRQEHAVTAALTGGQPADTVAAHWGADRAMAAYLDGLRLPPGSVVLDTTNGFPLEVFSQRPQQFIVASDYDFQSVVAQLPQFHGYVAVCLRSSPPSVILRRAWPGLLAGSATWAHLQRRIGPWELYRIGS